MLVSRVPVHKQDDRRPQQQGKCVRFSVDPDSSSPDRATVTSVDQDCYTDDNELVSVLNNTGTDEMRERVCVLYLDTRSVYGQQE